MAPERKFVDSPFRLTVAQIIGVCIIFTGIIVLVWVGVYAFNKGKSAEDTSSIMAIGFFLIMIGFPFYYPDMLKSASKDTVSSMRVIVYMIVSVFVFLSVKIGWSVGKYSEFALDRTWAYILAIALGSKALQSFGENNWLGRRRPGDTPAGGNSNVFFPGNQGELPEEFYDLEPKGKPFPNVPPTHVMKSKNN
jgi:hypothetical protein